MGRCALNIASHGRFNSMAAQSKDSAEISRLLSEARSNAVEVQQHADTLKGYTNS
jgi:hypothetical protein